MKKTLLRLVLATLLILTLVGALAACGPKGFEITVKDGDTTLKTLTFEAEAPIVIDPDDASFAKPGYEVAGIYTDAAFTTPLDKEALATENLVLYIKYEPRPFKIIVIDDPYSTSYTSVDVTYNGSYTLTAPTREGYLFLGYTHVQDGAPVSFPLSGTYTKTNTISISAQWKKLASFIIYDELTNENVGTTIYADAEGNFTLPAVTDVNTGYNFGGYVIPGVTLTKQQDGTYTGKVTSDSEIRVTRKWTLVPSFNLIVNGLYGDDVVDTAAYKTGDTFTLPTAPTRDGYIFTGYTVGGQPLTLDNGSATFIWSAATTVTANWQPRVYITVRDERTNAIIDTVEVVDGAYDLSALEPAAGDREVVEADKTYTYLGLKFDGQPFAATGTGYTGGSITVIRDWDGVDRIFINIVSKGAGYTFDSVEVVDGAYTLPENPTLAGYYFDGYYTNEACTQAFDEQSDVTVDLTIYAKWRRIASVKVYNGTTLVDTVPIAQNGTYTLTVPSDTADARFVKFTRDGADFDATGTHMGEDDLIVMQVWKEILKFNWTVNANGGEFEAGATVSGTAEEGTKVALPTPTRDGYSFLGYYYGDGTMLANDGELYTLPTYASVEAKSLPLYAKWEISQNATGEQKYPDGTSKEFFREENGGELIYVFLTGRTYYFGHDEITFGGDANAITPVFNADSDKGYGFTAKQPGVFTMTQKGVTLTCRVEYYVGSAGAGTSTTSRLEANFKGGISTTIDAGHKGFLPDIVGGNVSLDRIPYRVVVKDGQTTLTGDRYTILPGGKIDFDDDLIGHTLTITYYPEYALEEDNVSATVTVLLNSGVNVYTNDELYAAFANMQINTINILRNITAALQPQHYTVSGGNILVHNDDYKNGVYLRLPTGNDQVTINGNSYKIDASGLPAINPELGDKSRWADGYTGLNESYYQLVNVQVGIFGYVQDAGNASTKAGGTLYMNDLYITGNEQELTRNINDPNAKTYWEKTYPILNGEKAVVASSGAFHGIIVREANAVLDNVKIEHTQSAVHTDGYDVTFDVNETNTPGTPSALLTAVTLNNVTIDNNFNASFFAWGQVGLTMSNTFMGRSSGPAIIFSDTPITEESMAHSGYAIFGENVVVTNFVTGAEPWFQSYGATPAAGMVKSMLGGKEGFYAYAYAYAGFPQYLTPTQGYGNDAIPAFNAVMVTNAADSGENFAHDGAGIGAPFTPVYMMKDSTPTMLNTTSAGKNPKDNSDLPPLPDQIGDRWFQHIPMTAAGASSMQVVIEVFPGDVTELQ